MTTLLAFLLSLVFAFLAGGYMILAIIQKIAPELIPLISDAVSKAISENKEQ